jgi:hypothetical protein
VVLSVSVPEAIAVPIVDSRDHELSGMNSHDPHPASAMKTSARRFRLNRNLGNKNGSMNSVGMQARIDTREAVRTIADNANTAAAPSTHTRIFLRS